jgi:hypothetical protein
MPSTSNSIGGLTLNLVAEESLRTLVPQLAPLTKIAVTDFGSYVAERGTTVATRYAGKFEAANYSRSTGFNTVEAESTGVIVTLADQKHVTVGFTDYEVATLSLERLRRLFMAPMANAVVKSLFDEVLGKVDGDFQDAYNGDIADFDRTKVADIAKQLTKANLPQEGRAALVSPDIYNQLVKDPAVAQAFSIGTTEIIRGNRLGMLHGIDFYEYNGFNAAGLTAGLNGVVSCREGLVVVTRVPAAPTTGGGEQTVVSDPDSGFSYGLRYWYDWTAGLHKLSATWLIGSQKGNPDALQKIIATEGE